MAARTDASHSLGPGGVGMRDLPGSASSRQRRGPCGLGGCGACRLAAARSRTATTDSLLAATRSPIRRGGSHPARLIQSVGISALPREADLRRWPSRRFLDSCFACQSGSLPWRVQHLAPSKRGTQTEHVLAAMPPAVGGAPFRGAPPGGSPVRRSRLLEVWPADGLSVQDDDGITLDRP